jgi:hypothetical protein
MLYFFPLILSVYYFFALGFLLCFLCFFSLFFWVDFSVFALFLGSFFRLWCALLCFWVPFSASGVLTFSALVPHVGLGFFLYLKNKDHFESKDYLKDKDRMAKAHYSP